MLLQHFANCQESKEESLRSWGKHMYRVLKPQILSEI